MIKILGRSDSINVRKVLWLCDELKIRYDCEDWGVVSNLLKRAPEFVKLNPNATIPVIMDGDFVLWQSNSILRYLANAYAGQNLYHRCQTTCHH